MFGLLMGTLQKFKQESNVSTDKASRKMFCFFISKSATSSASYKAFLWALYKETFCPC